jgi:hypothetical protein
MDYILPKEIRNKIRQREDLDIRSALEEKDPDVRRSLIIAFIGRVFGPEAFIDEEGKYLELIDDVNARIAVLSAFITMCQPFDDYEAYKLLEQYLAPPIINWIANLVKNEKVTISPKQFNDALSFFNEWRMHL